MSAPPTPAVYLAAAYPARDLVRRYAADLRDSGFRVRAAWLDETAPLDAGPADAPALENARVARLALADIDAADHLVAFTERPPPVAARARGGRHVELGYALARGKTVWTCGPALEHVFHFLVPPRRRFHRWPALLGALRGELP